MPLTILTPGKEAVIEVCRTKDTTRKLLEGIVIISGVTISVISEFSGNGYELTLRRSEAEYIIVK